MRRLREWFNRKFINPVVESVRREHQQAILDLQSTNRRLTEENHAIVRAQMEDPRKLLLLERQSEWAEALGMYGSGPWKPTQIQVSESGKVEGPAASIALKEVGFWELELALEDRGWQRQLAMAQTEFSRYGLQQIMLISRLYKIKNPLVKRGVEVSAHYCLGRGVEVSCEDDVANEAISEFLEANKKQLGIPSLIAKEETLHTDGNLFWCFFTDPKTGQCMVQTIDAAEVEDIITDPDNSDKEWFIKRRGPQMLFDIETGIQTPRMVVTWYVALGYEGEIPKEIHGEPVSMSNGEPVWVYHRKVGGLEKWKFGCPLVYSWIDWARAARHYLEDWCTIQRAFARFSWEIETKGGPAAIANFKNVLATTLANGGTWWEQNPTPNVGSAWVTGPGTKLNPVKTPQNDPEACRRVILMVAAAAGLPETFFGDATAGSLATAKSLDRPTELKFLARQEMWKEDLGVIVTFALERSVKAPKGKLREAGKSATDKLKVNVTFPAVLEHDILEQVNAIVAATTLNGYPATGIDIRTAVGLLLRELGVQDPEVVLEAMYPEGAYDGLIDRTEQVKAEQDRAINPPTPPQPGAPGAQPKAAPPKKPATANKETLVRAIAQLKQASETMQARHNGHA